MGSSGSKQNAATAQAFFDACEQGKGWAECKQYCSTSGTSFAIQACDALPGPKVEHPGVIGTPKVSGCKTIEDYCDWMAGVVKEFGDKATYEVKASAFDEERNQAIFYAVFAGMSDYCYVIGFDESGCVNSMTKGPALFELSQIWNDQFVKDNTPPPQK